jgi:hypothetical protein
MCVIFYTGSIGERVMARNRDIRENSLFNIAKREIPKGFLLPSI